MGDDVGTVTSMGSSRPWGALPTRTRDVLHGHRLVPRSGHHQSDPALQIPPHPLPAERLELPDQRRPVTGMDTAALDRPSTTTTTQQPNPTPQRPTRTQSAATNTRRRMTQLPFDSHYVPDTSAVPAPRPNLAGAQERSRCPTGRMILTAPSTGTHSTLQNGREARLGPPLGHIGTASYTSTLPPDWSTGQPSAFFAASPRDSALMIE